MLTSILALIAEQGPTASYVIACSGGLDSMVLLHLFSQARVQHPALQCTAVHVNHGLHRSASEWARACETVCATWQIPCVIESVHVDANSSAGLEAAARDARYGALAKHVQAGGVLVTAHHENDQAETLLLQLFRGSGVKGLSAMPRIKPFYSGVLARPLLAFSRAKLLAYAESHALSWCEDPSNDDVSLQRNYCRHKVIPVIEQAWPGAVACLSRVAMHSAAAADLLEDVARDDLRTVCVRDVIQLNALKELRITRQENVLRYWLQERGLAAPSTAVLQQIFSDVIAAREDANPCVEWQGAQVRRFRDQLYATTPLVKFDTGIQLHWDLHFPLALPGDLGTLRAERVIGQGIKCSDIQGMVEIRFRQGGEICYLPGRLGGHSLKHLYQEWNIPTWQRDRVPLLYHQGHLVSVVGLCICDGFLAKADEPGWVIKKMPA